MCARIDATITKPEEQPYDVALSMPCGLDEELILSFPWIITVLEEVLDQPDKRLLALEWMIVGNAPEDPHIGGQNRHMID